MISREKMLSSLVEASPSFKAQSTNFLEEWKDEKEFPYYIVLGEFAGYLIDKVQRQETEDFQEVFSVIENLHLNGDSYVKDAITVGLLEAIQNKMSNNNQDPEVFRKYLLEETTKWWDKLNRFWDSEEIIKND